MLASATLLTLLSTAAVPAPVVTSTSQEDWAVVTETVERISFPSMARRFQIRIDPLLSSIELTEAEGGPRLTPEKTLHSVLCPQAVRIAHGIRLSCATTRLDAAWVREGDATVLEVRRLRGFPTGAHSGALETAQRQAPGAEARFRAALTTPEKYAAALGLAELALSRFAFAEAVKWLRLTEGPGISGRVAAVHLCELGIQCGEPTRLFDDAGLPEPLRTEMSLRHARYLAFSGQLSAALETLQQRIADDTRQPLDDSQRAVCTPMVLAGLSVRDTEINQLALGLYVALNIGPSTPDAVRLAAAASDASARLGAPVFGAHLLSAVTPAVPTEDLSAHLAHAESLYLAGNDRVRAEMIYRFAQSRLARSELTSGRWAELQSKLRDVSPTAGPTEPQPPNVDVTAEMAGAVLARSRATAFQRESP